MQSLWNEVYVFPLLHHSVVIQTLEKTVEHMVEQTFYGSILQAPYKAFNRIGYAIHHISRRVLNSHSYAVTLSDYKNPIGKLPNPLVFTNFNTH